MRSATARNQSNHLAEWGTAPDTPSNDERAELFERIGARSLFRRLLLETARSYAQRVGDRIGMGDGEVVSGIWGQIEAPVGVALDEAAHVVHQRGEVARARPLMVAMCARASSSELKRGRLTSVSRVIRAFERRTSTDGTRGTYTFGAERMACTVRGYEGDRTMRDICVNWKVVAGSAGRRYSSPTTQA